MSWLALRCPSVFPASRELQSLAWPFAVSRESIGLERVEFQEHGDGVEEGKVLCHGVDTSVFDDGPDGAQGVL